MSKTVTCPKCSECRSNSHHWMDNTADPGDGLSERIPTHICKHCDQQGYECPACCGDGLDMDELNGLCRFCRGEGVIPHRLYELLSDLSGSVAREIIERWDAWEAEAGQEAQKHQAPVEAIVMQARIGLVIEKALIEICTHKEPS